jgi:putative nucleotidyltransferase with HDIG domain
MMKHRELLLFAAEKIAQAVGIRDTYTGEHSQRVTHFAVLLGYQLHLSAVDMEWIKIGTPLHDLGKIGIEDAILRKPGKLTPEEFEVMKTHTTKGAEIIAKIPEIASVVPIVRSHHERWDGHGYPDGLASEAIPLLARIVAVAEGFDAMTFDTPYRKGIPVEEAFAELEKHQGSQYDPNLIRVFLQGRAMVVEQIEAFKHS